MNALINFFYSSAALTQSDTDDIQEMNTEASPTIRERSSLSQTVSKKTEFLFKELERARSQNCISKEDLYQICEYIESQKRQPLPDLDSRYDKKETQCKVTIIWDACRRQFYLKNMEMIGKGKQRKISLWLSYDGNVLAAGKLLFPNPSKNIEFDGLKRENLILRSLIEITVLKKFVGNDLFLQYHNDFSEDRQIVKNRPVLLSQFCNGNTFCASKDLFGVLSYCVDQSKGFDIRQILQFFYDALRALALLENNAIHRDIKPDNYLVRVSNKDENLLRLVLGDFGFVIDPDALENPTMYKNELSKTICGSLEYLSFELRSVLQDKLIHNQMVLSFEEFRDLYQKYGHAADVWATACVLYAVLYQKFVLWYDQMSIDKFSIASFTKDYKKTMQELLSKEFDNQYSISENMNVSRQDNKQLFHELNILLTQMFCLKVDDATGNDDKEYLSHRVTGKDALLIFKQIVGDKILAKLET